MVYVLLLDNNYETRFKKRHIVENPNFQLLGQNHVNNHLTSIQITTST